MISRLGELLRLSIDGPRGQWASLEAEIAFTDAYLEIEAERLGDRLRIVKAIAPGTLAAKVPSILIQPLAENAIRHGLAPLARGGTLTLRTELAGPRLRIVVADDGSGTMDIVEGIGLRNTRLRLAQLYPQDHLFAIESRPGAGFSICIEIPYDLRPDR